MISALTTSLVRAQAERSSWPVDWQRAFDMSDTLLQLTAPEAEQLAADLLAVFRQYRRHTPGERSPEGSQIVGARYQVYPVSSRSEP